jgi:hypothetical protein
MIILYILLVAYILSINFYAFLLVKSLRDKEREMQVKNELETLTPTNTASTPTPATLPERITGKLCITGLLGGAITIYVCMFVLKYKRTDLLLMVLMPLLGVLNIYLFVLLFRSGFSFFVIR